MDVILNGIGKFFEVLTSKNVTSEETPCQSAVDHYMFYQLCLIPAAVLTLLMASTKRRRQVLMNVLDGKPGLVFPMDTLTRSSRISYCCAFGATGFLVYEILIEQKFAIAYDGPIALRTLIAIFSVFIYGMVFLPVFACLALGTAFSYGLGSLYVWMFFIIDTYKLTECNFTRAGRMVFLAKAVPGEMCLAYLSISLPIRFVKCIMRRKFFVSHLDEKPRRETLEEIKESYQGEHVRALLRKPKIDTPPTTLVEKAKSMALGIIHDWIYHRETGFRYPARLISVMFVAACVVYVLTIEFLFEYVSLVDNILDVLQTSLDTLGAIPVVGEDPAISNERTFLVLAYYLAYIVKVSAIVAIPTSYVISFLTILHMLSSFRTNLYALYRGDFRNIPPPSEKSAMSLCVGSIKYAGFQVAYIVWAYVITCIILFIFGLIFAVIIRLLMSGVTEWLTDIVLQLWPSVLIAIGLLVAQMLLARFFFLQKPGEYLRLDNRRSYFTFVYFMFFFNIFMGLFSCLMRIIKAIGVGTIFLARLDNSTLPRKFEFFDPGFNAYQGYIHMEAAHTHPVVNVFIRLLTTLSQNRKKEANGGVDSEDSVMKHDGSTGAKTGGNAKASKPVNVAARFNWLVTYTLLHNPTVRIDRKGYIQALKKARKEGLKIPISDKPITDFDLVKTEEEREKEKAEEALRIKLEKEALHQQRHQHHHHHHKDHHDGGNIFSNAFNAIRHPHSKGTEHVEIEMKVVSEEEHPKKRTWFGTKPRKDKDGWKAYVDKDQHGEVTSLKDDQSDDGGCRDEPKPPKDRRRLGHKSRESMV